MSKASADGFSWRGEIAAALEENGLLSLFMLCRDADLQPLVDLVLRVAPETLVGKEQYLAAKDRPGNWPHLLEDALAAIVAKQNAGYFQGGGGWRDGLEAVAGRLGIRFFSDTSDSDLAEAIDEALSRDTRTGSDIEDARVRDIQDVARAAVLIASLLRTIRARVGLHGPAGRGRLGISSTGSPHPDPGAARSLLVRLASGAGAALDDIMDFVPGADFVTLPACNIMLAGGSGVGKSTLLNAIFGRDLAKTGIGRPVTAEAKWYEEPGFSVRLLDTCGLERGNFWQTIGELEAALQQARTQSRPQDQLHILWLCIDGTSSRIQDSDKRLAAMAKGLKLPAIVVVTKSWFDSTLAEKARAEFDDPPVHSVVSVIAERRIFAGGEGVGPAGLGNLVEQTLRLLPEANKAAMAAAQRVILQPKMDHARVAVKAACKAAATIAMNPIPFSDAALLAPVQIGMIVAITRRMGVELSEEAWKALVAGVAGPLLAMIAGRMLAGAVGNLLKAIPGVGSLAGGSLNAAVAYGLTKALGEAYLAWLVGRLEQGAAPGIDEIKAFLGSSWFSSK
jgi:uncharacterized protein (DUF697 family)/GTP-binding protein EngB required for normal cell division